MTVLFLKTTKLIDVGSVLVYNCIAHLQNVNNIVVNRVFLVLRQIRQFVFFASSHALTH